MSSTSRLSILSACLLALAAPLSQAQTAASAPAPAASMVARNVKQEARIEQGLQSGQLSTREAAKLQREQGHVDRLQSHALKDGEVSAAEQARIRQAQNTASQDIHGAKTNDTHGDPASASSQRLQADVARDVKQQQRIQQGVASGELTTKEAGHLEHGQAHVVKAEAHAARDGHVGAREQRHLRQVKDRQSRRIHHQKHDAQHVNGGGA
jgi:hypothetical protein